MKNMLKCVVLFLSLCSVPLFAVQSGEAEIKEIAILHDNHPQYDFQFRVIWTGSNAGTTDNYGGSQAKGERDNINVRHSDFSENSTIDGGHTGVDRIYRLVSNAMLMDKTVWIDWDENSNELINIRLKSTRN